MTADTDHTRGEHTMTTITVAEYFQGQTGTGQGGYTAQRFVHAIGKPLTVAFRSPIPLDTELEIVERDDRWLLVDPAAPTAAILEGTEWTPTFASTTAVSLAHAQAARTRFLHTEATHPAPLCWSCGLMPSSMRVHAGPLGDGRWATPWQAPGWAIGDDGSIDPASVWASIDCASGWYIGGLDSRPSVTVQFAVEITATLVADQEYSLVAWNGDYAAEWDGRKRGACAELFDAAGTSVARARSFWLSVG